LCRIKAEAVIGFTAPRLNIAATTPFAAAFVHRAVVNVREATNAFRDALGSSLTLGRHSGVVMLTYDHLRDVVKSTTAIWHCPRVRPWGHFFAPQCNQCGALYTLELNARADGTATSKCKNCNDKTSKEKRDIGKEIPGTEGSGGVWYEAVRMLNV
jgi:hypothetical protein